MTIHETNSTAINTLNSLIRGEISAVETYEHALSKFPQERLPELEENLTSHRNRVGVLSERVRQLGGDPATGSGAMGMFASLAETAASILGKDTAINVLESGEDRGLANYRKAVDELDPQSALMVVNELLPEQGRTHRRMSDLKHGRLSNADRGSRSF